MTVNKAIPASTAWFPDPYILPTEDTAPYRGLRFNKDTLFRMMARHTLSECFLRAGASVVSREGPPNPLGQYLRVEQYTTQPEDPWP